MSMAQAKSGLLVAAALLLFGACTRAPRTADEVVERSIAAHGGAALTGWKTLTMRGRIRMQDGITYNAGYLLLARAPDKLRVEHDMTRDRGRLFYEYFMNGPTTWSRANLVVGSGNPKQLQRWLLQPLGPAQLRRGAVSGLALKPDAVAGWQEPDGRTWRATDPRPAYIVSYVRDGEPCQVAIDKQTHYLLAEDWPGGRRLYRGFKQFGAVTIATRIVEITKGRQADTVTSVTLESVVQDEPIEDWLFTEDMPKGKR
jgi:hypothetical protein